MNSEILTLLCGRGRGVDEEKEKKQLGEDVDDVDAEILTLPPRPMGVSQKGGKGRM